MEPGIHMIGGDDKTSYAKNSSLPRLILEKVKPILNECIEDLVEDMGDVQNGVIFGDLGCSSGPNAFITAQNIIESFEKNYRMKDHYKIPTVLYFMNDMVFNDFNLVFKRLPEFYDKMEKQNNWTNGSFIVAAVAGTFYSKLFLDHSMHFMHSSFCLHWLSQVPKGLVTEAGISMNKLNIHSERTSPLAVQEEYANQFKHDFDMFLGMRSRELVQQGQLFLTFICKNSEEDDSHSFVGILGSALRDMVKEGYIDEEKLEYFNIPIHFAPADEIKRIIEDEGSFKITRFQTFKTPLDAAGYELSAFRDYEDQSLGRARYVATCLRAVFGPVLGSHFGEEILDDLFDRYADRSVDALNSGHLLYNTVVVSLKKEGAKLG